MNRVDVVLAFLLAASALRGYWRGFFRETFGLLALAGGTIVAFRFAGDGAIVLQRYLRLPPPVQAGAAFVVIFVLVYTTVNLVGMLLDHRAATRLLRGINRVGGIAFGAGKGAAVLAFVLLFLHLFPVSATLDGHIMSSRIGLRLVNTAADVIRSEAQAAPQLDSPGKS